MKRFIASVIFTTLILMPHPALPQQSERRIEDTWQTNNHQETLERVKYCLDEMYRHISVSKGKRMFCWDDKACESGFRVECTKYLK